MNSVIEAYEDAVKSAPEQYFVWTTALNNLGVTLSVRYNQSGAMDDLNRAIELITQIIAFTSRDHSSRASCLISLDRHYE